MKASTVFTAGCQAKGVGDMPQVYSSLVFELEFSFFFFFGGGREENKEAEINHRPVTFL